jgi:O-antigen/teichoic acid export membrane protein
LIATLPGFLFMIKNYEKPITWRIFVKDHLKQGKWLLSAAVLQWSSSNFFILVAGVYLGIEALGALRLVQSFFGIINIELQTIENYFLPKITLMYNQSISAAKDYLFRLTFIGAVIFGLLTLLFFIFSTQIIVLVGGLKIPPLWLCNKNGGCSLFFYFFGISSTNFSTDIDAE